MRDQLTVRLPKELSRLLDAAARRSQRKPSEIVRLALRSYLEPSPDRPGWAYDRVADLIGSFDSGVSELAEKHSEYILGSLKRGR